MKKSATRSAPKEPAGRKDSKIHIIPASASEIRAALGITPAEMRVAAKAIAAPRKRKAAHPSSHASATKRANAS